jgi:hypothetical protein
MLALPKAAEPLILAFSIAFSRPTFQRVVVLLGGAILSLRRRTVTAVLQTVGPLARGHWSGYQRVLCRAAWSLWPLGRVLAALILELVPKDQPVAVLIHWFPRRKFILVGDGGYGSHELARFCQRHRRHVTLVSRFHPQANLYDAPSRRRSPKGGRPRLRGRKRAAPSAVVQHSTGQRFTVNGYGGQTRQVELIGGTGYWYKGGAGPVPVRWVFVHDLQGTHRDQYLYSTDTSLRPDQIVSLFTGRWSIEVTFQEVRAHLGFTTPRNWSARSVPRTAPCLLGLFSLVSLIFARHAQHQRVTPAVSAWYAKREATFADAITTVRRLFREMVLKQSFHHMGVTKLPTRLRLTLLEHLSRAA